jgi:hypothetical protein
MEFALRANSGQLPQSLWFAGVSGTATLLQSGIEELLPFTG